MATNAIKPIYVLYGGDEFLIDDHRREIVASVVGDADPQLCVTSLDAEADLATVLDELRTLPFLAPRRVVIIRDADAFVTAHRDAIETYLQSPSATAALMLIVSSWPATTRLYKLVQKVGAAMPCSLGEKEPLAARVRDFAAKRGKKISPDAAELLLECVGRDLAAINTEIEKLSLYAGDRGTIELADVGKLVTATAGPGAFDITNAISRGDAPAALKSLAGLLTARGEEFKTMGIIAWHLRRALASQQAIAGGASIDRAMPRMPYDAQAAFKSMLSRRPLARLHADFRRLIATDLAMKSGADPLGTMQELVVSLCL